MTFFVPIIKFFLFTKNGNKKGHGCNKGLKISNFSHLMRSSASSQGLRKPILIACVSFASRMTTELSFCRTWEAPSDFGEKSVLPYENSWKQLTFLRLQGSHCDLGIVRGHFFSLISNLQYHRDPAKKKFWKSEHVHFLNIFEPNLTMRAAPQLAALKTMEMLLNGNDTKDS